MGGRGQRVEGEEELQRGTIRSMEEEQVGWGKGDGEEKCIRNLCTRGKAGVEGCQKVVGLTSQTHVL